MRSIFHYFSNKTVGGILEENRGIGPGFDVLRLALATSVVFGHSFLISYGNYDVLLTYKLSSVLGNAVPMFFALSGFLVARSAQRLKVGDFLLNRAARIVPALAVSVFTSALMMGSLMTTDRLHAYVKDPKFSHFFLNLIGFTHYELPAVFLANPLPQIINGSIWTVAYEMACYLLMSGFVLSHVIHSRRLFTILCAEFAGFYYLIWFYIDVSHPHLSMTGFWRDYISSFVYERGNFLYFNFLCGALAYVWRDKIPYSGFIALLCATWLVEIRADLITLDYTQPFLVVPATAYLVVYIGLLPMDNLAARLKGDYSYGIYLYSFPLQQLLVHLAPGSFLGPRLFICSIVLTTLFAMLSWHLIEKPVLSLRKKYSFTAHKGESQIYASQS